MDNNSLSGNKQLDYIVRSIAKHEMKLKNESLYPLQVTWIKNYIKSLHKMMERIMESSHLKELILKVDPDISSKTCIICNVPGHIACQCQIFRDWDHNHKFNFVKRNHLCMNCLDEMLYLCKDTPPSTPQILS